MPNKERERGGAKVLVFSIVTLDIGPEQDLVMDSNVTVLRMRNQGTRLARAHTKNNTLSASQEQNRSLFNTEILIQKKVCLIRYVCLYSVRPFISDGCLSLMRNKVLPGGKKARPTESFTKYFSLHVLKKK